MYILFYNTIHVHVFRSDCQPIAYMLHVWYIYLHLGNLEENVGKYTIHGAYGLGCKENAETSDFTST